MENIKQANFSTVERDFEKILERIYNNQNILKLLYYSIPNALEKEDIDFSEEKGNKIFQEIKNNCIKIIPNIEIPKNNYSIIVITFNSFSPNNNNNKFLDNSIVFDILCPINSWKMNDYMLRPFKIMHELNKEFDKQKLNGIGVVNFIGADLMPLGELSGYHMTYSVINDV